MKSELILITAEFPYGLGETFLESEINILAENFNNVLIFHSYKSNTCRNIPSNCTAIHLAYNYKIKHTTYFINLFNRFFLEELIFTHLKQNKKINIGIIKTALNSIIRAKKIKKYLVKSIPKQSIKNAIFYSYWCDDHAVSLCLLKQNKNVYCVSRAHGWDVYTENSKYDYLPFRKLICKKINKIYPISNTGQNYINYNWKIKANTKVSYLGVKKNQLLPYNNKSQIIVSCSNLIPLKRVHLIIDALRLIKKEITWFHFGDGTESEKLIKQTKTLPENIKVVWMGRIKNEEVLNYYKKINPSIFINVSNSEGIPVSIMEAYSFGIPCIATNVGGNHEIVNCKNGILIAKNPDPKIIADAIESILNLEKNDYYNFKNEAFNTWKNKFNAKINYQIFVNDLKLK